MLGVFFAGVFIGALLMFLLIIVIADTGPVDDPW
jgi:hypothetical protein